MGDPEEPNNDEQDELPDDVADAWANVLIDVHEKTKGEEPDPPPSQTKEEP